MNRYHLTLHWLFISYQMNLAFQQQTNHTRPHLRMGNMSLVYPKNNIALTWISFSQMHPWCFSRFSFSFRNRVVPSTMHLHAFWYLRSRTHKDTLPDSWTRHACLNNDFSVSGVPGLPGRKLDCLLVGLRKHCFIFTQIICNNVCSPCNCKWTNAVCCVRQCKWDKMYIRKMLYKKRQKKTGWTNT